MSKQAARKNESLFLPGYYYDKNTFKVYAPFSEMRGPSGLVQHVSLVDNSTIKLPVNHEENLLVSREDFLNNYVCCTHLIKIDGNYWPIIDVVESTHSRDTYNISYGSGIKNSANLTEETVLDFWKGHEDDILIDMQISCWRTPEDRIKFMRNMIGPFLIAVKLKP